MKSLRILFIAVPMWMLPFENGGPSCSMNSGLSLPFSCMRLYRSIDSQYFSISGSLCGSPARMGKSVTGRLSVLV